MKYEYLYENVNVNGEEKEVLCYKSPEYLRDYCAKFRDEFFFNDDENRIVKDLEAYLFFLPEAIDALVRQYHVYGLDYPVGIAKINLYNRVLIRIKDFNLFSSDTDPYDVYEAIYKDNYLGELLKMAADSIMDSDYYRSKYYIKNCVADDTIRKILDKNLNGHKANKIKINKEIFNLIKDKKIE